MNKPRFFLIASSDNENTRDLIDVINERGCTVQCARMAELTMAIDDGGVTFKFKEKGNILEIADIFIFRMYKRSKVEAKMLAKWLADNGKIVMDASLPIKISSSKEYEASLLAAASIPQVKTVMALGADGWKEVLFSLKEPIIVKPITGSQGMGIQKFQTREDAYEFLSQNERGFIAQEYIPIKSDVRVFVIGEQVLGAIERMVIENDYRSNVSLGAEVFKFEVDKEAAAISIEAVRVLNLDIAGVDLVKNGDKWCVLEVNAVPQWQGFKKATGINPAIYIVDRAMEKFNKKTV